MHKKLFFKIHLIIGLTAGIILAVIGLTGAILSFEKEIMKVINSDSYYVKSNGKDRLSQVQILEKFQEKYPKSNIRFISFFKDENSSYILNIASNEKGKKGRKGITYFINPYTAEILQNIKGEEFFKFIENIHRRLTFGEIGKQIIGASVIGLLLLLFSGVYIYWPRIKHAFLKSFTFKFKHKGRAFLSTIHSSLGLWVIPFYLLASLTGLFWSYEWYKNSLYLLSKVEKPQRKTPPSPSSGNISFEELQKVIDLFDKNVKDYDSVTLNVNSQNGQYKINYLDDTSTHDRARNEITLDIQNQKVLTHDKFIDQPLNERLMKSILALHTGEYFGLFGKIAMFITSLLMALFTITGFMMYFQRKKRKIKE